MLISAIKLKLVSLIGLSLLAGIASAAVINLDGTLHLLTLALKWHQFAPIKIGAVTLLVFHRKGIAPWTYGQITDAIYILADIPVVPTIDGIPVCELLDHLLTEKSFKQDDIESKFGIPRYEHTALTKKLKQLGVLVAGENNASTLNEDFSRQDLNLILRGKLTAEDLQPLFRRKDTGFTFDPSASEIESRVFFLLSSGFQIRRIEQMA